MEKSYPRYQYSVFMKNDKDKQLVIRTETFQELVDAKKNIDKIFDLTTKSSDELAQDFVDSTVGKTEPKADHFCEMHQKEMKVRSNPKDPGVTWWDHRIKEGDVWKKCWGKGWKNS